MKTKAVVTVLGLASTVLALPAAAQMSMSSAYIGGGLGQSKFKDGCSGLSGLGVSCDDSDTSFKIFGGYQFNRYIAAELGYNDLGKAKVTGPGGTDEFKATAWELSAVGSWPVMDQLAVFGRLGAYYGEGKISGPDNGEKKTTNLTFGAGAQYDFTRNFGVRIEWQRFSKIKFHNDVVGVDAEGDVDVLGASVLYRFQ
jgi:OOP family OmpA-OmpF porin